MNVSVSLGKRDMMYATRGGCSGAAETAVPSQDTRGVSAGVPAERVTADLMRDGASGRRRPPSAAGARGTAARKSDGGCLEDAGGAGPAWRGGYGGRFG